MRSMEQAEVVAFMRRGSRTGKLATVRSDGRPHVKSIWFDFDDANGDLVFLTWHESVAARNLTRDPRVSILVDEEAMPFAWARLDGTATLSEDPADRARWALQTCRRYVGDDLAEAYGTRNAVEGELVARVHPTRLVGQTDVAG